MEFYMEDCRKLLREQRKQEKESRIKRRWLMDFPLSKKEQKITKCFMPRYDKILPESLLREDDVYYEKIRTLVEKGLLVQDMEQYQGFDAQANNYSQSIRHDPKTILTLLDQMNNMGLCSVASIITSGIVEFDKTNWKMKKIIKEYVRSIGENPTDNHCMKLERISQVLANPRCFRYSPVALLTSSESLRTAAIKVLNELEDLPLVALFAMHRRLDGIRGYIPIMQITKSGWRHGTLIRAIKNRCMKMLSEHGEGNGIPDRLCKALAVTDLMSKLKNGGDTPAIFQNVSPEIEILQNRIIQAINVEKKMNFQELKDLQMLLDSNVELKERSVRSAFRKLLTEYLLEISTMDTIPRCLLDTLASIERTSSHINKRSRDSSHKSISKADLEEEIECLLNLSCHSKQIVWDAFLDHDVSQDFADAYMEDLDKGDEAGPSEDSAKIESGICLLQSCVEESQLESVDETNPVDPGTPMSVCRRSLSPSFPITCLRIKSEPVHAADGDDMLSTDPCSYSSYMEQGTVRSTHNIGVEEAPADLRPVVLPCDRTDADYVLASEDKVNVNDEEQNRCTTNMPKLETSCLPCSETSIIRCGQNNREKHYMSILEACDEATMSIYHTIGYILGGFAKAEGLFLSKEDVSYLQSGGSDMDVSKGLEENWMEIFTKVSCRD